MQLDHVTIVAPDCTCLRDFFVGIAGMEEGARPAFGVNGYWLYLDRRPVLHLIERGQAQDDDGVAIGRPVTRIDHLALRIDNALAWRQLLQRLRDHRMPYQLSDMRAQQELQLFVAPVPEVTVEFLIAARHLA